MTIRNKLLASAVAVLGATPVFADTSVLKAGDLSTADHWYGRAGGLIGAERVAGLRTNRSNPEIGVTYDHDVAARTNMSVDRTAGQTVTVTYDRDVAERTNMGRSRDVTPVQAAGAPAQTTN